MSVDIRRVAGAPLQIVATRGDLPYTLVTVASVTLHESRKLVKFGPADCSDIRFVYPGFSVDLTALGEIDLATGYSVLGALEDTTRGVAKFASLSGQRVIAIAAGAGFTITDPIGLDFPANATAKVQYEARLTSGQAMIAQINNAGSSAPTESYRSTILSTGQCGTAGAWSSTSRTAGTPVGAPTAILGVPIKPFPSVVGIGDSIQANRDDTTGDASGNHGFLPRGLYAGGPGGVAVPYCNLSVSGEKVLTLNNGGHAQRLTMLKYCSHVVFNLGTNDIPDALTLAQFQTRYTTAWMSLSRYGVKIYQVKILPRTTSTDSWVTAANQSYVTGFAPGGLRDQLNAWFLTQVGVSIDGVIDTSQYVEDQANLGKWKTDGSTANLTTSDGLHLSPNGASLAAAGVTDKSQNFSVLTLPVSLGGQPGY